MTKIFYPYLGWFGVGVAKHFIGAISGIQSWYCQLEYPIQKDWWQLLRECALEGLVFVIGAHFFSFFLLSPIWVGAMIGFTAHFIAEFTGIHRRFCRVAFS